MSSKAEQRCPGCGWHTYCGDSHDYHHVRLNRCCPVLAAKYDYRLSDTPSDWKDPNHGQPRGGIWSMWRRDKSGGDWTWLCYL